MKLSHHLRFNFKQARDMVLHKIAGDHGTPTDGILYYNDVTHEYRGQADGSLFTFPTSASGITDIVQDATPQLGGNLDRNGFTIDGRVPSADGVIVDKAIVNDLADISAAAFVVDEDTMSSDSATKLPTQQSVKAYVDNNVTALWDDRGAYDAATNTPDLDVAPSGVARGDTYTVSVAGNFFTEAVEVGDVLKADTDDASTLGDWTVISRNLDQATESVAGVSEIATQAETDTGTDDQRTVTPLKLASRLATVTRKHAELIGDNSTNPITVTHNLGTLDVSVTVREASTGELVLADPIAATANTVTIEFADPATTDQYAAIVIG